MQRRLALGFMSFAMLSLGACGRGRESQTARVDKLFAPWNSNDSPGCAVGISRNGAIVYEHGYGMANLELGVPITPATVFTPLGMAHTHVQDDVAMLVPNRASGYTRNASGWRAAKQDGGVVGNAGMYSTVDDLLRWE